MFASDVIRSCRELGFECRFRDGEYRLARPVSAYRNYGRSAYAVQEVEAYYTCDGVDCVGTARAWKQNIERIATLFIGHPTSRREG